MTKEILCTLLLVGFWWTLGFSHGDLDIRIQQATQSIAAEPDNEELYFHRGKLYYQHEEYQKGIADFQTAQEKGFEGELVHLFLAKCYYSQKDYCKAESEVHIFYKINPDHVIAHNLYGKILYQKKAYAQSASEFQYVIDHSIQAKPENYINAANSWSALESESGDRQAIALLEKGLDDLGPVVSLQQKLISTLMDTKRYAQAIALQKSIIDTKNRKESAYYTLYELTLASGNIAANAWNLLPQRIKRNSAMITLKQKIYHQMQSLTTTQGK